MVATLASLCRLAQRMSALAQPPCVACASRRRRTACYATARVHHQQQAAPTGRRQALHLAAAPLLLLQPPAARGEAPSQVVVLDRSNVLSTSRLFWLQQQLAALEADTGYRVRVVIADGQLDSRGGGFTSAQLRAQFGDRTTQTLYVLVDPSQHAVLAFAAGDAVRKQLFGQFLAELQGRYGNQFFVRDEGISEAVAQTVTAIATCLRKPGGCSAVPGVNDEGRWLTLTPSVVAGAVLGWALRLKPSGPVTSAGWALITSPLWAFLLVTFGIGPVVQRSSDVADLVPNVGSFALCAALLYLTPILGKSPLSGDDGTSS